MILLAFAVIAAAVALWVAAGVAVVSAAYRRPDPVDPRLLAADMADRLSAVAGPGVATLATSDDVDLSPTTDLQEADHR